MWPSATLAREVLRREGGTRRTAAAEYFVSLHMSILLHLRSRAIGRGLSPAALAESEAISYYQSN